MNKLLVSFLLGFSFTIILSKFSFAQETNNKPFQTITLKAALNEISTKFDIYIVYQDSLVANLFTDSKKYSKATTVQAALESILPIFNLKWQIIDKKNYVITKNNASNKAETVKKIVDKENEQSPEIITIRYKVKPNENIPITGTVSGIDGEPLEAVSITIKGVNGGIVTNEKGYFKLFVPSAKTSIVFSMVGYQTKEITANKISNDNIILTKDLPTLNKVIVVGYGSQKQKEVSSTITRVEVDAIKTNPVVSIEQMLQGRVAGLQVMVNDGNPGGSISMRIRGYTSVSPVADNSPLYIIDAVPTKQGLNLVNPSDIETIDVLKDAASQAIYGLQSSNGVIVITTKKGKLNKKVKVTLDSYVGIAGIKKKIAVTNPQQHAILTKEFVDNGNADGGNYLLDSIAPYNFNDPNSFPTEGTNWQDQVFRKAFIHDVNLGVIGGGKKTTYSFGLGYHNQDGIIKRTNFKRYSFKTNLSQQFGNNVKIGTNLNYSYANITDIYTNHENDGLLLGTLRYPTIVAPYNSNGIASPQPSTNRVSWGDDFNPVGIIDRSNGKKTNTAFFGSLYSDIKFLKIFNFHSVLGFAKYTSGFYGFLPKILEGNKTINTNSLYKSDFNSDNINFDNYLTYKKYRSKHSIEITAGYSFQEQKNTGEAIFQSGFDENQIPVLGQGTAASLSVNTSQSQIAYLSYFARANYNYHEKYYLQVACRRDASSRFILRNNRWGLFPAVSAAWRLSNEKILKKIKWISDLKIRTSYGLTGNDGGTNPAVNYYPGYSILRTNELYAFGNNQTTVNGTSLASFGNPEIGWEKNSQIDVGADVSLFNGMLNFTVDFYKRITKNMLFPVPLPGYFGIARSPLANAGSLYNKGVEFSISLDNDKNDFKYGISLNAAFNRNVVTDLNSIPFLEPDANYSLRDIGQVTRTVVGQSIGSFYGWSANGIYQNFNQINNAPAQLEYRQPGDVIFLDINKDGVVDENDKNFIGSPIPKFTTGFNFRAAYKNIDVNIFCNGSFGNKIYSAVYYYTTTYYGNGFNRLAATMNRWNGEGTSNSLPRLSYNDIAGNNRPSTLWLFDGSFVRIASLQAGYNFKRNWIKKMGVEKLRLYAAANNLYTFTKYPGFDPEVAQNSNDFLGGVNKDLQLGVDRGIYPQPRTFLVGINVTFN